MPLDLKRLQRGYAENALVDIGADGVEPRPPADLAAAIVAAGVAPERRLAIHRNHFATTLVDALGGVFEATRALVGADYFDAFALRFARAWPPSSPCLFEYGADLPEALNAAPGMASLAYVVEVARLEWAMHESFHAPAAAPLNPTRLAAVDRDDLAGVRFTPHPTLRLFQADFPVDRLWRDARAGDVAADALDGGSVRLLMTRPGLDVEMERLPDGLYRLIAALAEGATLGAAAAAAASAQDFDFGDALGDCLGRGVFADQLAA